MDERRAAEGVGPYGAVRCFLIPLKTEKTKIVKISSERA
jgi:hypothetical protein